MCDYSDRPFRELMRAVGAAMTYTEISRKQKVHALGGLAVTYNKLNQKEEARKSLEQLLKIDPENRFALSYIKKL